MAKKTMIKAMEKIQKRFHLRKISFSSFSTSSTNSDMEEYNNEDERGCWEDDSRSIPEDVKQGHFAVVAIDEENGLTKRFVVPLRCLRNPKFLVLLERAGEEYGFDHGGVVTVPCRPSELETILAQCWDNEFVYHGGGHSPTNVVDGYNRFNSSCSNMLETC